MFCLSVSQGGLIDVDGHLKSRNNRDIRVACTEGTGEGLFLCRGRKLVSRDHELVPRGRHLLCRGHEIVSHGDEILRSRGNPHVDKHDCCLTYRGIHFRYFGQYPNTSSPSAFSC